MMETAKLTLDLTRVLIWPAVLVGFLIGYRDETRGLLNRISKINALGGSAEFATGPPDTKPAPSAAPDVWFTVQPSSLSESDCIGRAETAVQRAGFDNGAAGHVTYGYSNQFVGAVWCGSSEGLVLITVAGPKDQGLQQLHAKLAAQFGAANR